MQRSKTVNGLRRAAGSETVAGAAAIKTPGVVSFARHEGQTHCFASV